MVVQSRKVVERVLHPGFRTSPLWPLKLTIALISMCTAWPQAPVQVKSQDDEGEYHERPGKAHERDEYKGWSYAGKGLQYRSEDGNRLQWFTLRGQFRYSYPFVADPVSPADLRGEDSHTFALKRARFKTGGHLLRPWLSNFVEIDLKNKRFYHGYLDFRKLPWLRMRVGQWKAEFNRERVVSSGKQQLVDRSIVNRDFTVDGQIGAMVHGRLFRHQALDSKYYFGVFTGNGRLSSSDGDGFPMYLWRYQWNFMRRDAGFTGGDVERHDTPAGSVGVAFLRNRSPFTRFDSDGGAQLEGFEPGAPGQYDLTQANVDAVYFFRGLSLQSEFHWKKVQDRVNRTLRRLRGGYFQAGYFPNSALSWVPSPLEIAGRVAFVDPDLAVSKDIRSEFTAGVNWYFREHPNKLNFEVSRLGVNALSGSVSDTRIRVQWELSM